MRASLHDVLEPDDKTTALGHLVYGEQHSGPNVGMYLPSGTGTLGVDFAFVDDKSAAFRLIFESDLTNEPAVGSIVEGTDHRCALAISHVIAADTGLPEDQAMLVAMGLTGMAQTAARFWLRDQGSIPRDQAAQVMSVLAWRGVSGFPKTH